ncbi:hypothetical protein HKX48_001398 [Thoreauomyces humboldtii]|nr:hypothetical protein HKX48_001398 [Thoreauomyces humboldtii]
MPWESITTGAMCFAVAASMGTTVSFFAQVHKVWKLYRQSGGKKKMPRLQFLVLAALTFILMDTIILIALIRCIGQLKEEAETIMGPAGAMKDVYYSMLDNNATFFQTYPAVYAAASDENRQTLTRSRAVLIFIGEGILSELGVFQTTMGQRFYNYIQGSKYQDSIGWFLLPRAPQVTEALLAQYTTPTQLSTGAGSVLTNALSLQSTYASLGPEITDVTGLGMNLGLLVTLFTWTRVIGVFLYGLSVLNRFAIFSIALRLPRWLIPTLRCILFLVCAFSVGLGTGIWYLNWNFRLDGAINTAHLFAFVLDIVVSSLMIKTLLRLRNDTIVNRVGASRMNLGHAAPTTSRIGGGNVPLTGAGVGTGSFGTSLHPTAAKESRDTSQKVLVPSTAQSVASIAPRVRNVLGSVRVTVPYFQLYVMFGFLIIALIVSLALAALEPVFGALLQMETIAYSEAILVFAYIVGFRFLSVLRSFRPSNNQSRSGNNLTISMIKNASASQLGSQALVAGATLPTLVMTDSFVGGKSPEKEEYEILRKAGAGNTSEV